MASEEEVIRNHYLSLNTYVNWKNESKNEVEVIFKLTFY